MAWTTPVEWTNNQLVTANDLNTYVKDNLIALKSPPSAHYECDQASDYTTTMTSSFVPVDQTNLTLTITTNGGDVMVHFHGTLYVGTGTVRVYLDVAVDGTRIAGDQGIVAQEYNSADAADDDEAISFTRLITGLSAGSHTFQLQWKVSAGTGKLYAGAGGAFDIHPQFWVREVS